MIGFANLLSLTRVVLAPLLVFAVLEAYWWFAWGCFVAAIISDIADGRVARLRNQSSIVGAKIDHGADAFFVICSLAAFSYLDYVTYGLPMVIAAAIIQYLFVTDRANEGALRPSQLGKWNGIAYFVLLGCCLAVPVLPVQTNEVLLQLIYVSGFALALTTVLSIVMRAFFSRNQDIAWQESNHDQERKG